MKTTKADLSAAIDMTAQENAYHPVRDMLEAVKWSGTANVDHLFVDYLGCPDDAYHRLAARMLMVGAVTRIFEPGHKYDFVPILEGPQGIKKSTFIEVLAMGFASTLSGEVHDDKRMVEQMLGFWIIEIPELQGFSKAEVTTLKAFITRRKDNVRLSYEKNARVFPRQSVFIGSTNDTDYLRDLTGDRRYWPIKCEVDKIDTDRLRDRVGDLWAEAVHIYRTMRAAQPKGILPLYLADAAAAATAKALQTDRRVETEEEMIGGQIEKWLNDPVGAVLGDDELDGPLQYRNETCVKEIKVKCLGLDKASADQRMNTIIGKAMTHIPGWTRGPRVDTAEFGRQFVHRRDVPILPSDPED